MTAIACKLLCHSSVPHLEQLRTGFELLCANGIIELTLERRAPPVADPHAAQHLRHAEAAHLMVEVRAAHLDLRLHFDTHDAMEISADRLRECDHYFKRSYSARHVVEVHPGDAHRIHPLGLNYLVFPDRVTLPALRLSLGLAGSLREKTRCMQRALDTGNRLAFHPRLRDMQAFPDYRQEPRVLFMTTAYDPYNVADRAPEKIEEYERCNDIRAACIRRLRRELGPRFHGGFEHNRYTRRAYPDLLLDDPADTRKHNYLRLLARFPIGVATTGLHDSIGWKFAEYVAFAKAIVTEPLRYEVPGNLRAGRHYLEFETPDDCVDRCLALLGDAAMRAEMMTSNAAYYQHYVRPDMLVMNALLTALQPRACTKAPVHQEIVFPSRQALYS